MLTVYHLSDLWQIICDRISLVLHVTSVMLVLNFNFSLHYIHCIHLLDFLISIFFIFCKIITFNNSWKNAYIFYISYLTHITFVVWKEKEGTQ